MKIESSTLKRLCLNDVLKGEAFVIENGEVYIKGRGAGGGMCNITNLENGNITEMDIDILVQPVKAKVVIESEE